MNLGIPMQMTRCFFNDLFIYFVGVLFPFFGVSKGLIRYSQWKYYCNFVRLYENAQDNVSKRAAVEKEPSTLEKDKEDQSKHYLTYRKPPILDMKWDYCVINVVEQASVSKFSTLDKIVTPVRLIILTIN